MKNTTELHYTHDQFPFLGIFEDLTEWANSNNASPLETYLRFRNLRRNADPYLTQCPDYASTSITSGGHARRPDLNSKEVVDANTKTARSTLSLMAKQGTLNSRAVILPADLGYMPEWKQSDYMYLWSLVISGVDFSQTPKPSRRIRHFEQNLDNQLENFEVDMDIMNSRELSAQDRAKHYFKYAEAFAAAAKQASKDATRVRRIINLVDPKTSLGCQTERILARILAIPVERVVPVEPAKKISDAMPDYELVLDIEKIIEFGGTVIELSDSAMLTLQDTEAG